MMALNIKNETSLLKKVVLGIGKDLGKPRLINPVTKMHLENNNYPKESDIIKELEGFQQLLNENNIDVLRPDNIKDVNQIFTRDIGFVIDNTFFIANMKYKERSKEINGLQHILNSINRNDIIEISKNAKIEGGDVIVWNNYVFVGISDRTNNKGFEFLKEKLPQKTVIKFELIKSEDPTENILHLDCTFQPIGLNQAIIFEDGFKYYPKELYHIFKESDMIKVSREQMNRMFPNVLSIAPDTIIIEKSFTVLRDELKKKKYKILEVNFSETSKLNGLLRCATLPLIRQ